MSIRSIKEAGVLAGKRVLVRVDFNVPIKNGAVEDDSRLLASLPTIAFLIKQKAKIILLTHVGRPEGKVVDALRVDPVIKRLSALLKDKEIFKLDIEHVSAAEQAMEEMEDGDIAMFENVRFSPDEKKNTGTLAKDLAALGDIFVLDGFAVSHRVSASVVGIAEHLPSYAGLLLEREIAGLGAIIKNPKKPFVAILGGAKVETKVPVMKYLSELSDHVLIGGGIANTYLKAKGYGVGASLVNDSVADEARAYAEKKTVVVPVDLVVGTPDGSVHRVVEIKQEPHIICKDVEAIFDIGPKTMELFASHIQQAKTLVWNGAMGYFEVKPYDAGTLGIARLIGERSKEDAFAVIGGGETLQSMDMVGGSEDIDLISTGGGAMLEYLSGKELPGIATLNKVGS